MCLHKKKEKKNLILKKGLVACGQSNVFQQFHSSVDGHFSSTEVKEAMFWTDVILIDASSGFSITGPVKKAAMATFTWES